MKLSRHKRINCRAGTSKSCRTAVALIGIGTIACTAGTLAAQAVNGSIGKHDPAATMIALRQSLHVFGAEGEGEPEILYASHDGYLFDNGPPNGVTGLSNVQGVMPDGTELNRAVASDFQLPASEQITRFEMSGVWFGGTGAETPIEGVRVRLWTAGPDSLPGELVHDETAFFVTTCDDGLVCSVATETGDEFGGLPEVQYTVIYDPPLPLPPLPEAWISIQPVGANNNFFQLTSASGLENINGHQAHVDYPDLEAPAWTPGNEVFDDYHDISFAIFGIIDDTGACCFGADGCVILHEIECLDSGGEYLGDGSSCDFCDPGIDPYTCEGLCGGQAPGGCWCDEACDSFGDCCDDVCDECPDLEFCDPGIDPYTCEGLCGGQAPGGCWCDEWCPLLGDCCDDACDECEEDIELCDPGIDPYTCEGLCGGQAPGGCWCDESCCEFGDCCPDQATECELCDPGIDPYTCLGDLNSDDEVGVEDLFILLGQWGPCEDPDDCPSDIDGNGVVDVKDLFQLLSEWGQCPEEPLIACCNWCDEVCVDVPLSACPVFDICHSVFLDMTCQEVEDADLCKNPSPPAADARGICFRNTECRGTHGPVTSCEECRDNDFHDEWSWWHDGECYTTCP